MTQQINNLSQIVENFDYFIVDLWGVLHDGTSAYPYSVECLKKLKELNKKIILLSNAPRRSFKAKDVLDKLSFKEEYYDKLITSGEVTYDYVKEIYPEFSKYIYIGPEKDRDLLDNLNMTEVHIAKEADFAVATGFEGFGSVFEEKQKELDE